MRLSRSINLALAVAAAGLATGVAIAGSQAATIAALQDGTSIAWIDTDQKKVTKTVRLDGGAKLVGIDVRPADGKLYGVTADGAIVTVDPGPASGRRRARSARSFPPASPSRSISIRPPTACASSDQRRHEPAHQRR